MKKMEEEIGIFAERMQFADFFKAAATLTALAAMTVYQAKIIAAIFM